MWDFSKPVTDINDVPEEHRGHYVQDGDKWVIRKESKSLVDAYLGVSKQNTELQSKTKEARNESAKERKLRQAYESIAEKYSLDESSAEALERHIDDLVAQAKGGKDLKVNMDKMRADMDKKVNEMTAAKDKELEAMKGTLSTHLVDSVATTALAELKGNAPLLLPHVRSKCKVIADDDGKYVVRVLDAQGDIRTDGRGGFMGVKDLVTEMKADKTFSSAFESEAKPGSGMNPSRHGGIKNNGDKSSTQKISDGLSQMAGR